jgi:hypothetical protein
MRSLAEKTGATVEGMMFASTGFQSGLVQHARGHRIRLARVEKDQNPDAFTIAFAEYDDTTQEVFFRQSGVGIIENVTVKDGGRIEVWQDGRVVGASDF